LQLRDPLQLFALAQAVEAPGLAREVGQPRRAQEALFQPAAVTVRQVARRPVAFGLLGGEALRQPVPAEDQLAEPRRDGALVLEREEEGGTLSISPLQLQLELGDRAGAAGTEEEVDEAADLPISVQ
jgi:hypothetical protein